MTARRKWGWGVAAAVVLMALMAGAGVLVLSSDWFREQVRQRIIEVAEEATGGRVELQRFDYDWSTMMARVEGFTLHGLEDAGREPLVRIPSLELAIHIRSLLRRDVELRSLTIEKPAVQIYVDEHGSTNLPSPRRKRQGGTNLIEDLLRLQIGRLAINEGLVRYDSRRIPLDVRAEEVAAVLTTLDAETVTFNLGVGRLAAFGRDGLGVQAAGTLAPRRVTVEQARVTSGSGSSIEGDAVIEEFRAPKIAGEWRANVRFREWPQLLLEDGWARADGRYSWSEAAGWAVAGRLRGEQLRLDMPVFSIAGATLDTNFDWRGRELRLSETAIAGLGGEWRGRALLRDWSDLEVEGEAKSIRLARVLTAAGVDDFSWDASLTGPVAFRGRVTAAGLADSVARANVHVAPVEGQVPLDGQVSGEWRQREGTVRLESSYLATASSRVTVEGVLGERMSAALFSTNPRDLEPALGVLVGESVSVPVDLQGGALQVEAMVEGSLNSPEISGSLRAERALWEGVPLSGASARFRINERSLQLEQISLSQNGGRLTGRVRLGLVDWRVVDDAAFDVALEARGLRLPDAARQAGARFALDGTVDMALQAAGTLDAPRGTLRWQGRQVSIAGERFTKLNGRLQASSAEVLRIEGEIDLDDAGVSVNATYRHPRADWRSGEASIRVRSRGFRLAQSEWLRAHRAGADAGVGLDADAVLAIRPGEVRLRRLAGVLALDGIRDGKRELGTLRVEAKTESETVRLAFTGQIQKTPLRGEASVQLKGQYPGQGILRLQDLPVESIAEWVDGNAEPLVRGTLTAAVQWRGDLAEPGKGTAVVTIPSLVIVPEADRREGSGDFTLRNAGAITMDVDANGVQVRNARLVGKDTSLTIAGLYGFTSRTPWDLSLSGTVNLGVLNNFEPDLQAGGLTRISANLRGAASTPAISGRMEIQNGSLYLRGLTNGIENANGTLYFDRDRASIEKLTAVTGGGTLALGGFIGFGGGEWSYRLQAKAAGVRVRYPEGVSTTIDSDLNLTGSQNASLLSGLVTVRRSGFSSRGDFASLIAGSGNPIPVPATQNEFLRNLQFDLRVRTSPDATFQTDYTQDLQTEADLRVRGSLGKPVVLGSVNVNQGEINFFGNRYQISRGEILFFNTATIQPSINLDLETRIRGVVVYIGVSGPLTRLNVNYRSEPPLQSREILALLTVGRAPTATATGFQQQGLNPSAQQSGAGTNMLAEASNTLLGGALSASVSSRVEKFFGVSRIKIDPNVTGVENIPQARLTIEQSLSRDITLTFSSNLSRSSQQIIRLEWDLSRQWSAIAVRDENGAFGVDFLFRKRFK
ncbi:MAG TPA: translocation/assembly module TamB domain-containing protein [Bryobacteraceae bacterium]|nr:hypothetical protein [Bryobacterales bacterium]HRJ19145.1 translocation/assembly module TamB domain-containing protein [Bryobacteraceae bacterium]